MCDGCYRLCWCRVRNTHSIYSIQVKSRNSLTTLVWFIRLSRKTTLLKQITKPLSDMNGYMIVCKFDQTAPADTILASSFDSFFENVIESSNVRVVENIKLCIEEALGEHVTWVISKSSSFLLFTYRLADASCLPVAPSNNLFQTLEHFWGAKITQSALQETLKCYTEGGSSSCRIWSLQYRARHIQSLLCSKICNGQTKMR